jgi:5-methylcytosine-specific restriction endonuclease McrA
VRGHAVAGETCEIDGLGPVPVAALRDLLPDAVIELIVTDGENAWNVTHLGRRANARQQVVLDWLGIGCTNAGCSHTEHLQVDHRIDWARVKVTELANLDWLCPHCHKLKTHRGWGLVLGRGRRRFVPPDDPAHPRQARVAA